MGKENEGIDGMGRVMISIYESVSRGSFHLCFKEGETLVTLYKGSISELGDSYFANGEARIFIQSGLDVYYVFNPSDLKDKETRRKIVPENISLDGIGSIN